MGGRWGSLVLARLELLLQGLDQGVQVRPAPQELEEAGERLEGLWIQPILLSHSMSSSLDVPSNKSHCSPARDTFASPQSWVKHLNRNDQ